VTDTQQHTVLASFDLTSSNRQDLIAVLKAWTSLAAKLAAGDSTTVPIYDNPQATSRNDATGTSTTDDSLEAYGLGAQRLTITVGFGRSLFTTKAGRDRFGISGQLPAALVDLPHFAGDEITAADSDGDLFLQACADDPQVAFHALRSMARIAPDVATLRWTQLGFSPSNAAGTPRNLMGFKDGTINSNAHSPANLDATVWAGPEGPPWMRGGSYLVYRRIRITLEHWDRLAPNLQEQVVGRQKVNGAPLGETSEFAPLNLDEKDGNGNLVIPATSHVRLAAPASNRGAVILRRAFSYNNGTTPFVEALATVAPSPRVRLRVALPRLSTGSADRVPADLLQPRRDRRDEPVHHPHRQGRVRCSPCRDRTGGLGRTHPAQLSTFRLSRYLMIATEGAARMTATRLIRAPHRRAAVSGIALVLGLTMAAACGSSSSGGSTGSGTGSLAGTTITLYNAQHEQTTDAMIAAFTKQTGIKVRVDNDDEDVLTAQIEQEGGRSPADVFYTENSNWLQQLDDRGMLAPVDKDTLANIPASDSASNGNWVGVSARVAVLVYNPTKISASQLPTSVLQLADPEYKGKIEIAPSETDFWPVIDSVARTDGQARALAWLKGLKANAGSNDDVPDNETLTSDVSEGTTDLALINHYYYYRLRAEVGAGSVNAKLAYFAPRDPGYVEGISGAAILKSSKHQAAAQAFLNFMTSVSGQTVLAHGESFEYPLHVGVAANPQMPPLDTLKPTSFTPAELGTGLEAKTLLQEAGLI
jgi:iron(III) transport system substrate-binding protein